VVHRQHVCHLGSYLCIALLGALLPDCNLWQRLHFTFAMLDWQVYKGIKDGIHEVAIKIFKAVTTERDLELLQTEIAVLRSCNNGNIVHFYGVCFKQTDAWLVMELLEKGNLYNALAYGKGLCTWYNRYNDILLG